MKFVKKNEQRDNIRIKTIYNRQLYRLKCLYYTQLYVVDFACKISLEKGKLNDLDFLQVQSINDGNIIINKNSRRFVELMMDYCR